MGQKNVVGEGFAGEKGKMDALPGIMATIDKMYYRMYCIVPLLYFLTSLQSRALGLGARQRLSTGC